MTTTAPQDSGPASEPTKWSIDAAKVLYNVDGWGDGFFDICEQGRMVVRPDRAHPERTLDLFELALDLEAQGVALPVLLRFSDILRSRIEALHAHGARTLAAMRFLDPERPKRLLPRLRRLFGRAGLEKEEVNILRGILTALAPGTVSVTGHYAGLSATTNNAINVTASIAPGSVPSFAVNLTSLGNGMSFHDLSGAPGARIAYWNNLVMTYGNVTNQINDPADYQGNLLTGTVVQVLPNNPFSQTTLTVGTRTTNESMMFNTMFDQGALNELAQDIWVKSTPSPRPNTLING